MQLKHYILTSLIILLSLGAFAQEDDDNSLFNKIVGEVEIDILASYYKQDGEHSAVTGGVGSEELKDEVASITVNIPIDTLNIINFSVNYDTYTSASTDMVDWYIDSIETSASSHEERKYGHLSYTRVTRKQSSYGVSVAFSEEYDVESYSGSLNWTRNSKDDNKQISINLSGVYDNWDLIFPVEYRDETKYPTDSLLSVNTRLTASLGVNFAMILTPRLQSLISYSFVYQNGLLSCPFQRVFFYDSIVLPPTIPEGFKKHYIDQLPNQKFKHALSLRTNYYPFNFLILRTFARGYYDSFNVKAVTLNIETPFKITRFISVFPFYRFHYQTATQYFYAYQEAHIEAEFYTSDYDLSEFNSQKYGIGLSISPPLGILHINNFPLKQRVSAFKTFEIRYAKYKRSDGLNSFIVSAALSFVL